MHYSNLVLIEPPDDGDELTREYIADAVETAMGPSEDHGGFWDWYQIGGRWTGTLSGYDPETDPANREPCEDCEATGTTTHAMAARYPAYAEHVGKPCIQCQGTGQRTKWPTEWTDHAGDVCPLVQVTPEQYERFYRVIARPYVWSVERYEPWHPNLEDRFVKQERPSLEWLKKEYPTHLAVVVDNHS